MMRYEIRDTIMLGFLTHNDSYDILVKPGNGYIKFDGNDIIYVQKDGVELVSHTVNHAISIWLEQGKIKEINDGI